MTLYTPMGYIDQEIGLASTHEALKPSPFPRGFIPVYPSRRESLFERNKMRLSFNEIRARAANFAREWAGKGYEKGETQTFYNEFFDIFGISRKRVASFEAPVKKLGQKQGFMDLFWPGMLLVEQKSLGRDLTKAKTQAFEYFPNLKESELPRFILVSDFQSFELHELQTGVVTRFNLADLPQNVEAFGFIIGVQRRAFKDQDPVNIEAAELMGALHDALKAAHYDGRKLERFLVRLVFCLFADDTGIFEPRDLFNDFLETRAREDGSDLGPWLVKIFQTLNTPEARRSAKLDEDLARFPYINGDLFGETLEIPDFDASMRALLLEACRFDWSAISPAIFGSLFQSVMNDKERRAAGAHYTTEKNILKTIGPLFLDGLRAEFEHLKGLKTGRDARLKAFHDKLASLTFLDPACGAGNFLVIAYRELRQLEIELLLELTASERNASGYFSGQLDVSSLSRLDVSQFYGIEIGDFAAHIAETALWMMDHIMNNRLSLAFGHSYLRIPLRKSPHILCADALETDWAALLPPESCGYVGVTREKGK